MGGCQDQALAKIDRIANEGIFEWGSMNDMDAVNSEGVVRIFGYGRRGHIGRRDFTNVFKLCEELWAFPGREEFPAGEKSNQDDKGEDVSNPLTIRHK
jgi:hypothetical protein